MSDIYYIRVTFHIDKSPAGSFGTPSQVYHDHDLILSRYQATTALMYGSSFLAKVLSRLLTGSNYRYEEKPANPLLTDLATKVY